MRAPERTMDYIRILIEQAEEDEKRMLKQWDLLKNFRREFLMYACDTKKYLKNVRFVHVIDTCEIIAFLFPRDDPCSDISCFVMKELHSMRENFLIIPSVVEELLKVMARDLATFAQSVEEVRTLLSGGRSSYALFFDREFLGKTWRKIQSIMRTRALSYKHDPTGPVKRIVEFLRKYTPMRLDDLPIKVPEDVDSPVDDVRRKIETSIRRMGPTWDQVIKTDARTANVTLFLNRKAKEIKHEKLFFPIYTRSMAFDRIKWREDVFPNGLPLCRPYLPLCMRITSHIMITESEVGHWVIEKLVDKLINLYRHYGWQRLPPATVGLIFKPLSVIVDCTKEMLEKKIRASERSEGDIIRMHPDIREWTKKQIERCRRFLNAVDDIREIEMKAAEGLEKMYRELVSFLPEYRRKALREALERILEG